MTIYEIKKKLGNNIGKEVLIKYNLGRNKYEDYKAVIKELYDYVFIVDGEFGVKSFSYRDIMTKTIHIDY
jgi:uncharacterized protein Veg